jgi:hypothetical protein
MKFYSHRVAVIALAAALSLPSVAAAAPRFHEDRDFSDRIVRVIRTIQKFFGVTSNVDGATPPLPPPTNP